VRGFYERVFRIVSGLSADHPANFDQFPEILGFQALDCVEHSGFDRECVRGILSLNKNEKRVGRHEQSAPRKLGKILDPR